MCIAVPPPAAARGSARRLLGRRPPRLEPSPTALLTGCISGAVWIFAQHQRRHVMVVRDGMMGARHYGGISRPVAKKLGNFDLVYKTLRHITAPTSMTCWCNFFARN